MPGGEWIAEVRLRILVLGKYYPPYYGGIETLTRNWCEGFVRQGGSVTCVVAHDQARTVRETVNGVAIERCARLGEVLSTPVCPRYLGAARRSADIIQLHFPNPLADVTMLMGARRVPLVITYHSDIIRQSGLMGFYRPLLRWLLRRASRIVVATPPQLEASDVLGPYRERCEIIPFGLDLDRISRPAKPFPALDAAIRDARGRPIILNIGRLVGYKGQRYLIQALRFVNAVGWLVGTGPLRAELEAVAAAVGVADRVRFWGEVADENLPAVVQACDIFVLSSITPNEAFGLVQVEAMACGKPLICCRLSSGVPYVNQDGVTGLVVPPADANALGEALQRLIADPDLRDKMGRAGIDRARTRFSLDAMVGRYWSLFERLTSERMAA